MTWRSPLLAARRSIRPVAPAPGPSLTLPSPRRLPFVTGANGLDELRIVPGVLIWERILLSDGSPARLVTSLVEGAAN